MGREDELTNLIQMRNLKALQLGVGLVGEPQVVMIFTLVNTNITLQRMPPCGMVSIEPSEQLSFRIIVLLALEELDSVFASLGEWSAQCT